MVSNQGTSTYGQEKRDDTLADANEGCRVPMGYILVTVFDVHREGMRVDGQVIAISLLDVFNQLVLVHIGDLFDVRLADDVVEIYRSIFVITLTTDNLRIVRARTYKHNTVKIEDVSVRASDSSDSSRWDE